MKKIVGIIVLLIVSICIFCLGFSYKSNINPNTYYQVYLNGKTIGVIDSQQALENYIDSQNNKYKNKFGVSKIYAPNGLEIKKIETYNKKTSSVKAVYEQIEKNEPFTIKGYQFIIKKENEKDNVVIYTLNKNIFDTAIESTIKTFIGSENYEAYKNKTQSALTETGTIIENVYVGDNITTKQTNIPVTEQIYTKADELAKFFVFGDNVEQKTYTVQIGDTIDDVAFNNQISVEEFLISNPSFTSSKNLLFPGQQVIIGVTDPQISVVEEEYSIKDQEVKYSTEYQYDADKIVGDDDVIQSGENGLERITQRVKYVNGAINYVDPINKEELKPTISEIVLKGEKHVSGVGSLKNWGWPTNSGYTISSDYIYRINPVTGGRELHNGIDIAGTGYGSPVYSANNGVVIETGYRYDNGNYIVINHNNGYYTLYAHLSKISIKNGAIVEKGQVIGAVGQTGYATGPHLHFTVSVGGAPFHGGRIVTPWTIYR